MTAEAYDENTGLGIYGDGSEKRVEVEKPKAGPTPGPWTFYADTPSTDPNWHIVTTASRMRILANVHIEPGNEMDLANARLITAAPELFEGCRKALSCASIDSNVRQLIREAVAKATGGAL